MLPDAAKTKLLRDNELPAWYGEDPTNTDLASPAANMSPIFKPKILGPDQTLSETLCRFAHNSTKGSGRMCQLLLQQFLGYRQERQVLEWKEEGTGGRKEWKQQW